MDTQLYLDFARGAIHKSRTFINKKCREGFHVSTKADHSLVTEVDRETEQLLRREIAEKFPTHGIVGEEFGVTHKDAEFKWYLDPIDGTISFSHGIPLYGTIMALHHGTTPLVGIIDHPGLDRCYYALQGGGAFCNGERIRITDITSPAELAKEIIATGDLKQFEVSGTRAAYTHLLTQHELVRTIPDCVGHTLASQGAVGAMLDFHVNAWDIAATQLMIEEAGGKFLVLKQFALPSGKLKYNIICGKPKVVAWLSTIFT